MAVFLPIPQSMGVDYRGCASMVEKIIEVAGRMVVRRSSKRECPC